MQLLKGKNAVVTGGSSGIGRQIALVFAEQGANVYILDKNPADEVVVELSKIGASQIFASKALDVTDRQAVETAVEDILSLWGNIDILVNNAGITMDSLLMKMTEEQWDAVLSVNLKSIYFLSKGFIRQMLKQKSGKIINMSSVVGLMGNAGQANYAASKAGLIGFSKSLALEVASRGINVNCIAPGFIQTRMTDKLTDEQKEKLIARIPMSRLGQPTDIANAALFLASHLSDYITGQVLVVDGGMVM